MMNEAKKPSKTRTIILIGIIVVLAVALCLVIFLGKEEKPDPAVQSQTETQAVTYGDEKLGIDPKVDEQLKDYQNVALLGIDAKDLGSEKGNRSDAIIIVSLNKKTNQVNLFSVYRDTYLKIDDTHGLDKVNHAYAYGSLEQSLWALNRNLDLNIREGIALSWEPIAEVVDQLGGIPVNLQSSEVSALNRGLDDKNKIAGSGDQTLNGKQAVLYSRIRKDSPKGDLRRNERMKIVLAGVMEKAKTVELSQLFSMMDKMLSQSNTNMSNARVTETLSQVAKYNLQDSVGWPYKTSGWTHDSIWYGVPITLKENVSTLHEKMFNQKGYAPTAFVTKTSDDIEGQSGYHN